MASFVLLPVRTNEQIGFDALRIETMWESNLKSMHMHPFVHVVSAIETKWVHVRVP